MAQEGMSKEMAESQLRRILDHKQTFESAEIAIGGFDFESIYASMGAANYGARSHVERDGRQPVATYPE